MPILAKGIIIFGKKNRFKKILFEDKQKAQRHFERCRRRGLDVQYIY